MEQRKTGLLMSLLVTLSLGGVTACESGGVGDGDGDAGFDFDADADGYSDCTGCIDSAGQCVGGRVAAACGHSGNACEPCGDGEECAEGECTAPPPCSDRTCAGCCNGDVCEDGDMPGLCGVGGVGCAACAEGSTCDDGLCSLPCEATCEGCCDDAGECQPGDADDTCRDGFGIGCIDCGEGRSCFLYTIEDSGEHYGACSSRECEECDEGCCDDGECVAGTSVEACGSDGEFCRYCPEGTTCLSGRCLVEDARRWDVVIVRADGIEPLTSAGEPWDFFGGLPDPMVTIHLEDDTDEYSATSTTISDSISPDWDEAVLRDVPGRAFNSIDMEVLDDDPGPINQSMGSVSFLLGPSAFDGVPRVQCMGVDGAICVTYRIRAH